MSEPASHHNSRPRVLVVEDEPEVSELVADLLDEEGLEPACVGTDADAYATLQEERSFACMLVDVNLGKGTTGYDVARFARKIDPQLPVVYVSGQTSSGSFEQNGVTGALFLEKPFTPQELLERVHMLLGDNDDEV